MTKSSVCPYDQAYELWVTSIPSGFVLMLLWAIFTGKAEGFQLADEAKESMHLAEETKAASRGGDSA